MTRFGSEAFRLLAAPSAAIRVECIDTLWGLTALRPHWDALLRASAANGPFLTWEWLHAWWTHLHGRAVLNVLVVREGTTVIAIAPLMLARGAMPGFSRLEFLGTGHAGSDYLDLIVRIGREAAALDAIARFLEAQGTALRLDHLPEGSLGAQLAGRLAGEGWAKTAGPAGLCPVIALAGHTWDSYLATVGSAHRANVRRRLRAIDQQFEMRFEPVTTDGGRRDALEALGRFHERRFGADGGSTAFLTPALRAFQEDATRLALGGGWLRMYVLWLNDEPAAVMYGFLYHRQFYFYQHGFDERYSRSSAGLVVMALTIRAAIEDGAETFDLLWGTESYKALWARETHTLAQIDLFQPDVAGWVHQAAVEMRRRLGTFARRARGSTRAT
jgi:CelD/BcsL family acetyltransferase involved in cellulose biosynthesis